MKTFTSSQALKCLGKHCPTYNQPGRQNFQDGGKIFSSALENILKFLGTQFSLDRPILLYSDEICALVVK